MLSVDFRICWSVGFLVGCLERVLVQVFVVFFFSRAEKFVVDASKVRRL